jgi:hypothetical protein
MERVYIKIACGFLPCYYIENYIIRLTIFMRIFANHEAFLYPAYRNHFIFLLSLKKF